MRVIIWKEAAVLLKLLDGRNHLEMALLQSQLPLRLVDSHVTLGNQMSFERSWVPDHRLIVVTKSTNIYFWKSSTVSCCSTSSSCSLRLNTYRCFTISSQNFLVSSPSVLGFCDLDTYRESL